MTRSVHIVNGPNLNLLGQREPHIYGHETLNDIHSACITRASELELELVFEQSNDEGRLVDLVQAAGAQGLGLILNAGAYTHTSIALMDALKSLSCPIIEVHISNIFARESFRHHSYISPVATGVLCGFGSRGYIMALDAIHALTEKGE